MGTHCRVKALIKIAASTVTPQIAPTIPVDKTTPGLLGPTIGGIYATRKATKALPSFAKGVASGVVNPVRTVAGVGSGLAKGIADAIGQGDAAREAAESAPAPGIQHPAYPLTGGLSADAIQAIKARIKARAKEFGKPTSVVGLNGISNLDKDRLRKIITSIGRE